MNGIFACLGQVKKTVARPIFFIVDFLFAARCVLLLASVCFCPHTNGLASTCWCWMEYYVLRVKPNTVERAEACACSSDLCVCGGVWSAGAGAHEVTVEDLLADLGAVDVRRVVQQQRTEVGPTRTSDVATCVSVRVCVWGGHHWRNPLPPGCACHVRVSIPHLDVIGT